MGLVPWNLEDVLDQQLEEERAHMEETPPSTVTSTTASACDEPQRARGQHGRHKKQNDVHMIAKVGPCGEPLQPIEILGKFIN
jgi:hypothetical protein